MGEKQREREKEIKKNASKSESESVSRSVMSDFLQSHGLSTEFSRQEYWSGLPCPSPGKNTGAGCHALLQGIFQTQGSNPGLLHCRWILYKLSYQGSPAKILKYRYRASLLFRSLCRDLLCFHLLINVTLSERNIFKFYHSLYCTMPVLKADKRAFSSYVES